MEEKMKEKEKEKALLVGVDTGEDQNFDRSMEELGNLAQACDMQVSGLLTQRLEQINKALYIGSGKMEELCRFAEDIEADVIIFDNTLSPSQQRNLQKALPGRVMDRTALILDIFSTRAQTREAKLQVESARLQYMLPRLVGLREALSRQGGTSGSMSSRGAGETKLELDRRRIEHRLSELRKELEEIAGERDTQRKRRFSSRIPRVSLVGYTNAGKSTIMNHMIEHYMGDAEKKVLEKDMLFATLDTTVRRIEPGDNRDFLLSDTVGFIHKLPHHLVKAFRSTLEEVASADLLLHVIDYSDPHYKQQIAVTEETLQELNASHIPVIYVYNKADLCEGSVPRMVDKEHIFISAKQDKGLTELIEMIVEKLYASYQEREFLFPYAMGNLVSYFMEQAKVLKFEYQEDGIYLKVSCSKADYEKYREYLLNA